MMDEFDPKIYWINFKWTIVIDLIYEWSTYILNLLIFDITKLKIKQLKDDKKNEHENNL